MNLRKYYLFLSILIILLLSSFLLAGTYLLIKIPEDVSREFGPAYKEYDFYHQSLYAFKLYSSKEAIRNQTTVNPEDHIFIINENQPAGEITDTLVSIGIIDDQTSLLNYWIYKGYDRNIRAGTYLVRTQMPFQEFAEIFINTDASVLPFAFPAGWRIEEIENLIKTSGVFEFNAIPDPKSIGTNLCLPELLNDKASLEGFLYPDFYHFPRRISLNEMVCEMVNNFSEQLPEEYVELVNRQGLNLYESVTLASMVEKEAVVDDEAGLIAGVFINRLQIGMPLQSDPTVQYALGYDLENDTWWKNPLTSQDLKIDSLYNTYKHSGLPPTPICNPGINALMAVVKPAYSEYLYFRSACDDSGTHIFSETYEAHLLAACK